MQHDHKLFVLVPGPPVYWTFIRQADADPSLTDFSFLVNERPDEAVCGKSAARWRF